MSRNTLKYQNQFSQKTNQAEVETPELETPEAPEVAAPIEAQPQVVEAPKPTAAAAPANPAYDDQTVAVWVWVPGFNQDTAEPLNKPYIHTANRIDWETQIAPMGDSSMSTLEHIGLSVVGVIHIPAGVTWPNVNEKTVQQLKNTGFNLN